MRYFFTCLFVSAAAFSCQQDTSLGPNSNPSQQTGSFSACTPSTNPLGSNTSPNNSGISSGTQPLGLQSDLSAVPSSTTAQPLQTSSYGCPGQPPLGGTDSSKVEPTGKTESVSIDLKASLISPEMLKDCNDQTKIYNRVSKECVEGSSFTSEWCTQDAAPGKFGSAAESLRAELSKAIQDGYVIDQCGTVAGQPFMSTYKEVLDGDMIMLQLRSFTLKPQQTNP